MADFMFPKQQQLSEIIRVTSYVTIAEHLTDSKHQQLINAGTKYDTLKDAYDAYAKLVTEGKYQNYKDTLPKS